MRHLQQADAAVAGAYTPTQRAPAPSVRARRPRRTLSTPSCAVVAPRARGAAQNPSANDCNSWRNHMPGILPVW